MKLMRCVSSSGWLVFLPTAAASCEPASLAMAWQYCTLRWRISDSHRFAGWSKAAATVANGWVHAEDEAPQLVRGIRGALERNTMRYYLAIDAYLHALGSPAPVRFEQSLERWFADTERFARQLREESHDDYITMK